MTVAFNVKVLCGQPNYSAPGIPAAKHETRNGVEIFRAGDTTLNKNVIMAKLTNLITLGIATFFKEIVQFQGKGPHLGCYNAADADASS